MAKQQPDFSSSWARINAKLGRHPDIEETKAASKSPAKVSPFVTFGDVRGNVINIGSISKAELAQLLAERTQSRE